MAIRGWAHRVMVLAAVGVVGVALLAGTASPVAAKAPGQWWADELDLAALHKVTRGEGVTIGMVDTGVDVTHPDLVGADIAGKDAWSGANDGLTDPQGHGTGMASLLVGQGKDGGILGVAPDARLLVYSALYVDKPGYQGYVDDDLAAGVEWLVEQRVDVIVLAYGNFNAPKRPEAAAIRSAERLGIPVIGAVGNVPTAAWPDEVEWPAATPGVLAVSGTKKGGEFAPKTSVHGPQTAIAAPAEDIGAALPHGLPGFGDDLYFTSSGTSVSAALVGGITALLAARYPDESREQLLWRLTSTAVDKGPEGRDEKYGFGVVDAVAAIAEGVDLSGAAPAPISRGQMPVWDATGMPEVVTAPSPWTRTDIWVAGGLALVAGMVLVMVAWRSPVRVRLAALGLAVVVVGMAAAGTAVTVARANHPPATRINWPGFTTAAPDGPFTGVCQQVIDETGVWLDQYLRPIYIQPNGNDTCEVSAPPSSYPGGTPQDYPEATFIRITWTPLKGAGLRDPGADGPYGCEGTATVWWAANAPVCTMEPATTSYNSYAVTRVMARQTWVTIEILQEWATDRPDHVHTILAMVVPLIVDGTRTAT